MNRQQRPKSGRQAQPLPAAEYPNKKQPRLQGVLQTGNFSFASDFIAEIA